MFPGSIFVRGSDMPGILGFGTQIQLHLYALGPFVFFRVHDSSNRKNHGSLLMDGSPDRPNERVCPILSGIDDQIWLDSMFDGKASDSDHSQEKILMLCGQDPKQRCNPFHDKKSNL
jgi:hypothetical protein